MAVAELFGVPRVLRVRVGPLPKNGQAGINGRAGLGKSLLPGEQPANVVLGYGKPDLVICYRGVGVGELLMDE